MSQVPKASKLLHRYEHLQDIIEDHYHWMRERDSEPVLAHLKAENEYFQQTLASTEKLQADLFREMKSRMKEDDSSPPSPLGGFEYYVRFETSREYQIYCRRPRGGGTEEVLLDVNALATGLKFCDVANFKVSPDQSKVAFGLDRVGRRLYSLKVKDLKTGEISEHELAGTGGIFEWANDNETLFAIMKNPETLRYETCLRYNWKTGQAETVYFEKDEIFSVYISKSQDRKVIFLSVSSFDSSEIHILDADRPLQPMILFAPREKKHEYHLSHSEDGYYIVSNWQAENFRIMWAPGAPCAKENWKEIVPHNPEVLIENLLGLESHLIIEQRQQGLTQLRILDRQNLQGAGRLVSFPDPTYTTSLGSNLEYKTDRVRLIYSSLVQPQTWYDYNLNTEKLETVKVSEVPNYDASKYECARIWSTAQDGTRVPMSVLGPRGFQSSGPKPTLVYAYGSYGLNVEPNFRSNIFSLIDRGFVYAIAHIRGGSDMGRAWYENGRMMKKKNTFTDFIDCSEHLIKAGIAQKDQVYAMGGSAGGLLMGAVINLRPDLYRGIVAQVPFVDVINTMLDPTIPLTTPEYEQWGNPNEKEAYEYMKSYSPYDNVKALPYPHIYVETGYHDSQVQYWEPAKWVARLRENKTTDNVVLFRTNMEAGHGGASGRFERLKEVATEYAFILWASQQARQH